MVSTLSFSFRDGRVLCKIDTDNNNFDDVLFLRHRSTSVYNLYENTILFGRFLAQQEKCRIYTIMKIQSHICIFFCICFMYVFINERMYVFYVSALHHSRTTNRLFVLRYQF